MVLAGLGVEHDELVSIAEPLLADLPSVKRPEEPKSVYVGGDYRCQADSAVSALWCLLIIHNDAYVVCEGEPWCSGKAFAL